MRIRWGIVLLVVFGLPGLLFGLTAASYLAADLAEGVVSGGAGIANIFTLALLMVMAFSGLLTLAERKWSAAMQDRIGPNRANIGPFRFGGALHFLADGLKMLFKEDFTPRGADKWLFSLAPALAFVPVFCLFAVIPVAPLVFVRNHEVALQIASPDFGVLYIFAFASLAVFGTAIAGWASNNKLALLGGVRAASQMISYEVALGLSLVGAIAAYSALVPAGGSSLRLEHMVDAQQTWLWGGGNFGLPAWGILLQPLGFVLFFAAAFAETKRAPFDMPEGESEIVGYFVEYSGLRFGMFMLSEFMEVVILAGVTAAVFFGGYHLPFGEQWLMQHLDLFWFSCLQGTVFWLKVVGLAWLQLMIRWTFPRFRYDHVQRLGWRILLPAGLFNVFATAALVLWDPSLRMLALFGLAQITLLVFLVGNPRRPAATAPEPTPLALAPSDRDGVGA